MKTLAKIASGVALFGLLLAPGIASAQESLDLGFGKAAEIGLGQTDLRETVVNITQASLGFLGIIAVIIILWGGFQWMTAGGDEKKIGSAKSTIIRGIVGLIIILLAYAIAQFVIGLVLEQSGGGTPL